MIIVIKVMKSRRRLLVATILIVVVALSYFAVVDRIEYEKLKRGCDSLEKDVIKLPLEHVRKDEVSFIAFGDGGTADVNAIKVASAIDRVCKSNGCDFALLLGDNFYVADVYKADDPLFKIVFEDIYKDLNFPFFAIIGNHDKRGSVRAQVEYSKRSQKWYMPNFDYTFSAGPVKFIATNTNCKVLRWQKVDEKLADRTDDWVVVYGHHPVYSSGIHGDDWIFSRWYWGKYFLNKVDLYFAGHDHHLEHLRLADTRTDFIIAGSGGKNSLSSDDQKKLSPSRADSKFADYGNGFVWTKATKSRLEVSYYSADGEKLYSFTKSR